MRQEQSSCQKTAWRREKLEPEGLIWDNLGIKEGVYLVLMEAELETFVAWGFQKQNWCVYCDLLEEMEYNISFEQ